MFGICLGTQIVLSHSDEGDTECLGLIEGSCPRLELHSPSLKVPHMGWDSLRIVKPHHMLKDVQEGDEFYFVHSYFPQPHDEAHVLALCEYEITFPAVIGCRNLLATQFHPEKSGRPGLSMLKNFCTWDGTSC